MKAVVSSILLFIAFAAHAEELNHPETITVLATEHAVSRQSVSVGQTIVLTASGTWKPSVYAGSCGPDGKGLKNQLWGDYGARYGSLMVRINNSKDVQLVGTKAIFKIVSSGQLEFFMNGVSEDRSGEVAVTLALADSQTGLPSIDPFKPEIITASAKNHVFSKQVLVAGQTVGLSASGNWKPSAYVGTCSPNGTPEGYGTSGANYAALMVKMENSDQAQQAGTRAQFTADRAGRLEFFMNSASDERSGELVVSVGEARLGSDAEALEAKNNDLFTSEMTKAAKAQNAGDFTGSETAIRQALVYKPENAEAKTMLTATLTKHAMIALNAGGTDEADALLRTALGTTLNEEMKSTIQQLLKKTSESVIAMAGDSAMIKCANHKVGDGIPLILVHGHNSESHVDGMCRWKAFLSKMTSSEFIKFDIYIFKHDSTLPVGFNGTTGNAAQLNSQIKQLFPNKKVLFIAHSRGGLVCRAYMNHENRGENVYGLITLGTPHHGTPGAIPEWAACFLTLDTCNFLYKRGQCDECSFNIEERGFQDLAWDNLDGVIKQRNVKQIEFQGKRRVCLSPDDFNCQVQGFEDDSLLVSSAQRKIDGTLADLNKREKYFGRISAFAAFDDDFSDNERYAITFDIDKNLDNRLGEHDKLGWATWKLNRFSEVLESNSINYFANDGLVPLQSALFLDLSDGIPFAEKIGSAVKLKQGNIAIRRLVRSHHIFSNADGVCDHIHLLETNNSRFWSELRTEVEYFWQH